MSERRLIEPTPRDGTTFDDLAQDALNRMARAHRRNTGCHLTAEMVRALGISFLGETFLADDPRPLPTPLSTGRTGDAS